MSQITKFVIEDSGRAYRQTITEQDLDLNPEIMARYTKEMVVRLRNVMAGGAISSKLAGNIHVAIRGKQVVFTVQLSVMPLRARFSVAKDDEKILVPNFTSDSTPMALEWTPPAGMRLLLLIAMLPDTMTSGDQFLVAVDVAGRFYRLPTTNCYDNCKLCTGKYDNKGITYSDAIGKALNQFAASDWQGDLADRGGASGMANSKLMFRFKPLEKEGFEQLPPASDWTLLCTKVNFEFVSTFITL